MKMCLLVAKEISNFPNNKERMRKGAFVDAYWIVRDGGLLGLIAHLLLYHKVWRECKLRFIGIVRRDDEKEATLYRIEQYLRAMRLRGTAKVAVFTLSGYVSVM
ncbi:unnamed protein product [Gongylonema pulchrum]|uniref:SLC12 domain-containing protein n=1 Tax=Gongylonema pulchrum TaxID=637853 RepID=A0A183D5X6_9BILA|nr:unnamed protein product [Gongylonema pulchrum]